MTFEMTEPARRAAVVVGGGGSIGRAVAGGWPPSGIRSWRSTSAEGPTSSSAMSATKGRCGRGFAVVRERVGVPLVLVHAAGLTGQGGVEDEDPATWRRIIEVNLTSAYLCVREVIAGMRQAGGDGWSSSRR